MLGQLLTLIDLIILFHTDVPKGYFWDVFEQNDN